MPELDGAPLDKMYARVYGAIIAIVVLLIVVYAVRGSSEPAQTPATQPEPAKVTEPTGTPSPAPAQPVAAPTPPPQPVAAQSPPSPKPVAAPPAPVAHASDDDEDPALEARREEIASAVNSLVKGMGVNADIAVAGDTLMVAGPGCTRKALSDLNKALKSMDVDLAKSFRRIRCFGGTEIVFH